MEKQQVQTNENEKPKRKRGNRSQEAINKRKKKYTDKQLGLLRKINIRLTSDLEQANNNLTVTKNKLLECQLGAKKLISRVSFILTLIDFTYKIYRKISGQSRWFDFLEFNKPASTFSSASTSSY